MPAVQTKVCNPRKDLVLVLADEVEAVKESEGGIQLPDIAQAVVIKRKGTVIAVGPNVKHTQIGERVLFSAYAGTTIDLDGVDHELMPEDDILAGVD